MHYDRRQILRVAAVAPLALPSLRRPAFGAETKSIRIGFQKFNTFNLLKGTGRLETALEGFGVTVKWAEFPSAPATYEALNTGNIDIAHAGDTNTVFAQASGSNFAYLASEVPNPRGLALLVRKDSGIRSVEDLKGRKFVTGRGWTPQYLALRALEAKGLSYSDIQSVYVSVVADARLTFQSKQVDAVGLWEPFLSAAELEGDVRVIRNAEGLADNRTIYVGNPNYVQDNPSVVRTVFRELRQVQAWAADNPAKVAALFAPELGVAENILFHASQRRRYGVEKVTPAVIAAQQQIADAFHALSLIPKPIRVSAARFADDSTFL